MIVMEREFIFTSEQKYTIDSFRRFLKDDDDIFILRGYAGTGKTTILKEFVNLAAASSKQISLMAPTGRAAKVLSDKTGRQALTIHRSIYKLSVIESQEGDEENDSVVHYYFPLRKNEENCSDCLCIIDEASMISSRKSGGDVFSFGTETVLDDLLTYFNPAAGGKLVFVGDPAQLPPVGDNCSKALDKDFFEQKGLKVVQCELTEILRQDKDNCIQRNSMMIRNLLNAQQRNEFKFSYSDNEFKEMEPFPSIEKFVENYDNSLDKEIVICYSNANTHLYNDFIRRLLFPGNTSRICEGDRLLVISNNYSHPQRDIMNGEFATVLSVSEETVNQSARIYVDKTAKKVSLFFREVTLAFEDGFVLNTMIIDSLLNNDNRDLTYEEICALYVNFKMRHPEFRPHSLEYRDAMMQDPYLNALKVKYGYAITGHKSQGGEWENVIVDYQGRSGLNDDSLRWCYTVTTRARKKVYAINAPSIAPFDKLKINPIAVAGKYPETVCSFGELPDDGFHAPDAPAYLKAKCLNVKNHLEGSGYGLKSVSSFPYRERYTVIDDQGLEYVFDAMYSGSGVFKDCTSKMQGENVQEILELLNKGDEYFLNCAYSPSTDALSELYAMILSACDEEDIIITKVKEMIDRYKVLYFFYLDERFCYIEFFINKNGMVTYAQPRSPLGEKDEKFNRLLSKIKH